MKKETGIAIFLGVLFGVLVAVFIASKTRQFKPQKIKNIPVRRELFPTLKDGKNQTLTLEITEPKNGASFSKNTIKIKGKANKDSLIVIQSPVEDISFKNKTESFEENITLALGENIIVISAYGKEYQTRPQSKVLKIYYLDEQ